MDERSDVNSPGEGEPPGEGVGDALRAAVERTLAVTADSATETRRRAQSLLDDVVRRGQVAREQVARRGEETTTRLGEAITDLRPADGSDLEVLRERLAGLELRIARLESRPRTESSPLVEDEVTPADRLGQRDSGE